MKLAARLFLGTSLLVAAAVFGLATGANHLLREHLEDSIAAGLEANARLIAALLPGDSTHWPEAAQQLGRAIGHRVTLVARDGRVRGDADFDRAALPRLENHRERPEIRAALAHRLGRAQRRSASNNERQMYVAVAGGPPGVAVVRVSASLAAVDAQVHSVERAVAWIGLLAVLSSALLAWPFSAGVARPLASLTRAARRVAAGQPPEFPSSRVPEIAELSLALHDMAGQLAERFAALRSEQEETRTLIDSMTDGVIAANSRSEIVTCNAAARRLLGYLEGALPPLAQLFHDKRARELLQGALAGRHVEQQELHRDDRDLLVTARSLPNGGVLLVLRDVTAIRRLEAVRRDFVANVSHELKTPLTSIAGYAETLADEETLDAQSQRFVQTILSNARRMQALVDDLLDLSRIESGGWQPQARVVDLGNATREAWTPLADGATARNIRFDVRIAREASVVLADPRALHQILANLLGNAVRHSRDGGTITVAAQRSDRHILIDISDTGVGIAAEHLPRIFERFYRADPGRARETGGTGLGLAIVKHLVEAHGGRIDAESTLGLGTTIRLSLPAESMPPDAVTEP